MNKAFYVFISLALATSVANATNLSISLPLAQQADEAQFHFLRGNRAYQEKRFEDALVSYYLSNRLVANRNVQFNIARCLDRLGRYDEAYRAWSTLLGESLPEKEQKAVQDAIDQLRPHLALLEIETTPPGATIYAGRRDLGALGTTPKSLALRSGTTKVILDREGYRTVELSAVMEQGKQIKLSAPMERIYGDIDIRRVPANAEIRRDFLDGEILRRGPGTVKVLPGPIVLFVSAPGFQTTRTMANALPDTVVPVDVLLSVDTPPTGTLVVRANIQGALIRIDGKEAGFAPAVIDGIAIGQRQIEILAEGRKTFSDRVEVKKNERNFVDARLGHADPEVTAATKSAIASESAPSSISVVTADEIAAFGYTSLAEALTAIRGTFTSNDRSYESVGFRGFSPPGDYTNRVLVLLDGHPINDAITGQGYVGHDFNVDLANVTRIEIVRGPGSVLYGTGALFGVINVVTSRPAEGSHASLVTMGGTMNTVSGRATASLRKGNAELMISAAAMHSDGESRFVWPTGFDQRAPVTVFDSDGERAHHFDLVGRLGPISLRAGFNDRKKYLPTGAYDTLAGSYNHDRRGYAELHLEDAIRGVQVAARAAYDFSWYHGNFFRTDGDASQNLKAQWLTGELRLALPSFLHQQITIGSEVVKQVEIFTDANANDPQVPKDLILSGYVVDDLRVSSRLSIHLGLRLDSYTESFGTTLTPRAAIVARPYMKGNTKLFFGRSFRAPSPDERTQTITDNLRPETIWSGELEHSHAITDDVHLVGAVFANWISDLIMLDHSNFSDIGDIYINKSSRVRSIGAEGEFRWEPGGGTLLSLSLVRQRVDDLSSEESKPFLNAPDTLFKTRVLCPLIGSVLRLGSELVLDSGRHFRQSDTLLPEQDKHVKDALLWNLSFSGEFRNYNLRYFVGFMNLLDVNEARAGFPTGVDYPLVLIPRQGRSMRAGLAWFF
jgi:outer membrane receptor for ferrienterochelin and colicins